MLTQILVILFLVILSQKIGLNSVRANQNLATSGGRELKWVTLVHELDLGARTRTRLREGLSGSSDLSIRKDLIPGRTSRF